MWKRKQRPIKFILYIYIFFFSLSIYKYCAQILVGYFSLTILCYCYVIHLKYGYLLCSSLPFIMFCLLVVVYYNHFFLFVYVKHFPGSKSQNSIKRGRQKSDFTSLLLSSSPSSHPSSLHNQAIMLCCKRHHFLLLYLNTCIFHCSPSTPFAF